MPTLLEEKATSLGMIEPQVKSIPLQRGERFTIEGQTERAQWHFVYTIEEVGKDFVVLRMDGKARTKNILNIDLGNNRVRMRLIPNTVVPLTTFLSTPDLPKFGIAFIDTSLRPVPVLPGSVVAFAQGMVRDTVPPPPKR